MIKILIISYYFPPCSAIGSKRWSKMFNQLGLTEEIDAKILTANWNGNKKQKNVYSVGPIVDYVPPKSLFKKKVFLKDLNIQVNILDQLHMKLYLGIGKI